MEVIRPFQTRHIVTFSAAIAFFSVLAILLGLQYRMTEPVLTSSQASLGIVAKSRYGAALVPEPAPVQPNGWENVPAPRLTTNEWVVKADQTPGGLADAMRLRHLSK